MLKQLTAKQIGGIFIVPQMKFTALTQTLGVHRCPVVHCPPIRIEIPI
jgi:hypothetical protein